MMIANLKVWRCDRPHLLFVAAEKIMRYLPHLALNRRVIFVHTDPTNAPSKHENKQIGYSMSLGICYMLLDNHY